MIPKKRTSPFHVSRNSCLTMNSPDDGSRPTVHDWTCSRPSGVHRFVAASVSANSGISGIGLACRASLMYRVPSCAGYRLGGLPSSGHVRPAAQCPAPYPAEAHRPAALPRHSDHRLSLRRKPVLPVFLLAWLPLRDVAASPGDLVGAGHAAA